MKHKLFHLQSLFAVVMCVIMAIAFTNCSKDDSEPDAPKVAKRMKSIDDQKFY